MSKLERAICLGILGLVFAGACIYLMTKNYTTSSVVYAGMAVLMEGLSIYMAYEAGEESTE